MPSGRTQPQTVPQWETAGDSSTLRFTAIPLRMRTLALGIAAIVLIGGLGLAAMLIGMELTAGYRSGSRVIVALGLLLAVPAALIFIHTLRRRTVACTILFDANGVRVEMGDHPLLVEFCDLNRFWWRQESDYARVELWSTRRVVSLITGLTKPPGSVLPQLPPLAPRVIDLLAAAGLSEYRSQRGAWVEFRRVDASVRGSAR